jgi:hypothetical protein
MIIDKLRKNILVICGNKKYAIPANNIVPLWNQYNALRLKPRQSINL